MTNRWTAVFFLLVWMETGNLMGQQPTVAPATPQSSTAQPAATTNAAPVTVPPPTAADTAEFQRQLSLAQAGDVQAEASVADSYYNGWVTPKNVPESYMWTLKAANQGNARAESTVAWYYEHGVVVAKDDAQALVWRQKAAQDGDAASQVEMGFRYENGRGVPLDLTQAAEWYKKAAIQGNENGRASLGYALIMGRGVPKDLEKGFAYLMSATGKNAYARFAVARCYSDGVFVERDPVEACAWCLLALEKDQQAAQLAATLRDQLSDDQIASAGKRADDIRRQIKDGDHQTSDLSIVFSGDSAVTMPFEDVSHHILIPVKIANQETDYLLVDTGADVTLLDAAVADRLKIKTNQYWPAMGTGSEITLSRSAGGIELGIPGLTISGANVCLLPNYDLDQYMGHPLAGLLGYDILRHMVTSIDYVNKTITFRRSGTFKPDATSESIPFFSQGVHPFITATVGSDAGPKKGYFLIDTGDGGNVTLMKIFQEINPGIKVEQSIKTGFIGIGGISYAVDGKLPQLTLGKTVISNPIATLVSKKQGDWAHLEGGFLGEKILSRFDVTFDSPDGTLFLKPNSHFADPFTYNNIGMGVKTVKGNYHSFVVYAIIPDSPAAIANFQLGDAIIKVDGVDAATLTLDDLYDKIDEAKLHHLTVLRAGVTQQIDLNVVESIK